MLCRSNCCRQRASRCCGRGDARTCSFCGSTWTREGRCGLCVDFRAHPESKVYRGGPMRMKALLALCVMALCIAVLSEEAVDSAKDKPRVFITDSQSWEISGAGGGTSGGFGEVTKG